MPSRVATAAIAGLLLLAVAVGPSSARAASPELLPDLDQEAPTGLTVSTVSAGAKRTWLLGFGSAVRNVGEGPLVIAGHRETRRSAAMVADQVVRRAGAPSVRIPGAGHLRYVVSPGHRHWHLLGFDRYELRGVGAGGRLRTDRKSGFCLGDRYPVTDPVLPSASPAPVFRSRCGLGQPGRLRVREGISVGYGDYYAANLEGQYLSLQGLPDGRYTLIHRVNADRRLRELRYDNDAASVLLSLHWVAGVPSLRVLARCDDSASCSQPPAGGSRRAPLVTARSMFCPLAATASTRR
jgi:hypothetical protein